MALHIYREPKEGHLCQGDILRPEPLRPRLKGHQDYFANKPYFYRFMVLTQTCDLARERDRCNFIFIAVIRRLSEAIGMRQFEKGIIQRTHQLLTDMLSHRYNKRGFFYLQPQVDIGAADLEVLGHNTKPLSLITGFKCMAAQITGIRFGHASSPLNLHFLNPPNLHAFHFKSLLSN